MFRIFTPAQKADPLAHVNPLAFARGREGGNGHWSAIHKEKQNRPIRKERTWHDQAVFSDSGARASCSKAARIRFRRTRALLKNTGTCNPFLQYGFLGGA